jgi:hypothetical protein
MRTEVVHRPEGSNQLVKPGYFLVPYEYSLYQVMATQLETGDFEQYRTWEEAVQAAQSRAGRYDIYKIYHEGHVTT